MRTVEYMSPTSLKKWRESKNDYYVHYLSDSRTPREPQTQPMAVGSGFDAYVKAYLYDKLIKNPDPKFSFEKIFESQVEPHNREFARKEGQLAFDLYKATGALSDLMLELSDCIGEPRFELDIKSIISRESTDGVPILGKPDVFFINNRGARVGLDWKVNGWLSTKAPSPKPGFVKRRPGGSCHKDCMLMNNNGIMVNMATHLEDVDEDWARQMATYNWLCGEEVGSKAICGIEQICGKKECVSHRATISRAFQEKLFGEYLEAWQIIKSGWIFREMSEEESRKYQELLDAPAQPDEDFSKMMERPR